MPELTVSPVAWRLDRLPFFEERHYQLAERLYAWRAENEAWLAGAHEGDLAPLCRDLIRRLAAWGFLDYVVPDSADPADIRLDVRSICIIREALAFDSCLADSMFTMQGLGTSPLWRHPDKALRAAYLEPARRGERIAALALTEPDVGSDVASMTTTATREGDAIVLNGVKTWITNGGIADHSLVIARTGEGPGSRGLSAIIVDADAPGFSSSAPLSMMAHHPLSTLTFDNCRVPASHIVGAAGEGFKAAMAGFDIFRPSVGGAAVGVARRALAETIARVRSRRMFGRTMAEMDGVQSRIADMTADTEGAAMAVYRAAWTADVIGGRVSKESALAKLVATEAAGRVVDAAVQLFGALGVATGSVVEQLYRDVRPMRIYEGASEVQKLVIARGVLGNPGR